MLTDTETLRHLLLDDLDAFIAAVLLLFTALVALSMPAVRRSSRRIPSSSPSACSRSSSASACSLILRRSARSWGGRSGYGSSAAGL
jgi:hypothetical protein